jgi:succinate dehydrogenase / fumarate reductase, cytochrome b subunit
MSSISQPKPCVLLKSWWMGERMPGMNRLRLLWTTSVGKKMVMAVTGVIWVAYLITHVLANLLVFQGPSKINAYSAFLHGTGGALWAARLVLIAALVFHVVAAIQLASRRHEARPVGYAAGREPHTSTFASRTIRWGGALILLFLLFHILHFTVGTVHSSFLEGDPYHNVAAGFRNPVVVVLYLIAMAVVGLHLYHGVWSSGRSLGMSPPSPRPLRRSLALVLALLVWLGFSIIPIAVYAGVIR